MTFLLVILLFTLKLQAMDAPPLLKELSVVAANDYLQQLQNLRIDTSNILQAREDIISPIRLDLLHIMENVADLTLKNQISRLVKELVQHPEDVLEGLPVKDIVLMLNTYIEGMSKAIAETNHERCKQLLAHVQDYYKKFLVDLKGIDLESEKGKALLAPKVKVCMDSPTGKCSFRLVTRETVYKVLQVTVKGEKQVSALGLLRNIVGKVSALIEDKDFAAKRDNLNKLLNLIKQAMELLKNLSQGTIKDLESHELRLVSTGASLDESCRELLLRIAGICEAYRKNFIVSLKKGEAASMPLYPENEIPFHTIFKLDNAKAAKIESRGSSNHVVTRLGNVFFKQDGMPPLDAGMEMAMYLLYNALFPYRKLIAATGFIVFSDVIINGKKTCYFCQISAAADGESLADTMERKEEDSLDNGNYSAHLVAELVTIPSDAKQHNFQVVKRQNGSKHVVGIDNDEALRFPIVRDANMLHFPAFKSILALMPNKMKLSLDEEVRKDFKALIIENVLSQWLNDLDRMNESYQQIRKFVVQSQNKGAGGDVQVESVWENLKFPFCLAEGMVTRLIAQFKMMQENLAQSRTHEELFREMMPIVARHYREIQRMCKNDPHESYVRIHGTNFPIENVLDISKPLKQGQERVFKLLRLETHGNREIENRVQSIAGAKAELKETVFNNRLQEDGSTPCHAAIANADPNSPTYENDIVTQLETIGADANALNRVNKANHTVLDLALRAKLPKVICLLMKQGAGEKCKARDALDCFNYFRDNGLLNEAIKEAFTLLKKRNPRFEWLSLLDIIFGPNPITGAKACTGTSFNRTCYLLPDAVKMLWKQNGEFIQRNTYGRRKVGFVEILEGKILDREGNWLDKDGKALDKAKVKDLIADAKIWFKELPNVPGFEHAVGHFIRQTVPRGAPYCELIRIGDKPYLISMDGKGKLLEELFKQQAAKDKTKNPPELALLDPISTSFMIILAMLINPEDGKPDNLVLMFDGTKYHLVSIDNENAFFPAYALDKNTKKPVRRVKTVLFSLDQMMQRIPPEVIAYFKSASPLDELKHWLHELSAFNSRSCELFTTEEELKKLHAEECCLGVPFARHMITRLYTKFMKLRRLVESNPEITHIDLLQKLEAPELALRYRTGFSGKPKTVLERFQLIDEPHYAKGKNGPMSIMSAADVLESNNITFNEKLIDLIKKEQAMGPTPALQELEAIRNQSASSELGRDLNKFITLKSDVEKEEFMAGIDFGGTKLAKDAAGQTKEVPVIEAASQKTFFEDTLKKDSPHKVSMWRRFIAKRAVELTTALIIGYEIENLTKLDISGCTKISEDLLPVLSNKCKWLESLNLSGISSIKNIWQQENRPLAFVVLRRLVLDQCNELVNVLLNAPNLRTLLARQCPKFKALVLASNVLNRLDLRSCELITDEVLDAIIKDCSDLKSLQVQGCPAITNTDVRELCPAYPATLLKGLSEHIRYLIVLLLQQDQDIKFIHLGYDRYKDPEFIALCKALIFNNVVEKLHLGANPITDAGLKALADMFRKNTSIKTLDLGDTNGTETGLQALADALESNTSLTGVEFGKPAATQIKEELEQAKTHPMMAELPEAVRKELMDKINDALKS